MGLLLAPSEALAKRHSGKKVAPADSPIRTVYSISFYLDYFTGDLALTPNYNITGLNISLTANGVTYLDTTVSLSAGQSYTDCLDFLNVGTYILTLSTADGIIDQYEITVEDD